MEEWTVLCSKHIFFVFNLLELRKGMRSDDSITGHGYSKCHCFKHIIPANRWTLYTPLSLLPDVAHTALVWYKFVNSKSVQNEILCNWSMKSLKFTKLSLTASVNMACIVPRAITRNVHMSLGVRLNMAYRMEWTTNILNSTSIHGLASV